MAGISFTTSDSRARRMRSNSRRKSASVAGSIFGRCVRKALSMPGQAASTACALSVAKPWVNSSANRACAAAMLSGEGCCSCARSAPGRQFAAASVTATARMRSGRMWPLRNEAGKLACRRRPATGAAQLRAVRPADGRCDRLPAAVRYRRRCRSASLKARRARAVPGSHASHRRAPTGALRRNGAARAA